MKYSGPALFISLIAVVAFGILVHVPWARSNVLYMDRDQGIDAVFARDIITHGTLFLQGPETSIIGFYHGPLWYYLVALGYTAFNGHPFGGVAILIALNLAATVILMVYLSQRVSLAAAVITGTLLQIFWPFFVFSSFSNGPYFSVSMSIIATLLLTDAIEGNRTHFVLAGIFVGLTYHAHILIGLTLTIWYALAGMYALRIHGWPRKTIFTGIAVIAAFLIPHVLSEFITGFSQTRAIIHEWYTSTSVFAAHANPMIVASDFLTMLGQVTIPTLPYLGVLGTILIALIAAITRSKKKQTNQAWRWSVTFIGLTLGLYLLSWALFLTNAFWRSWVWVEIPPLLFISCILLLFRLPLPLRTGIIVVLVIFQSLYFVFQMKEPRRDAMTLHNQLEAIDWVYQKAAGRGFTVYDYVPYGDDFPYQYLFWWYGRGTYGYLPCEYADHPGADKHLIPDAASFTRPAKPCTNLRFLIIEHDPNAGISTQWAEQLTRNTVRLNEATIDRITVEELQQNSHK